MENSFRKLERKSELQLHESGLSQLPLSAYGSALRIAPIAASFARRVMWLLGAEFIEALPFAGCTCI